jgi:hypothetical protein
MTKNVGSIDRALRILIGAVLIAGYFLNGDGAYSWLYLVGVIPLATGLLGTCGLYSLLGANTCPMDKR